MRRKQLRKLAGFLTNEVKDEWFFLGSWATLGFKARKCGTTACALGWATACFPRSRLKLWLDNDAPHGSGYDVKYIDSYGNDWHGYDAAERFFGIDYNDARYIFAPDEYPSGSRDRLSVAERICKVADRTSSV